MSCRAATSIPLVGSSKIGPAAPPPSRSRPSAGCAMDASPLPPARGPDLQPAVASSPPASRGSRERRRSVKGRKCTANVPSRERPSTSPAACGPPAVHMRARRKPGYWNPHLRPLTTTPRRRCRPDASPRQFASCPRRRGRRSRDLSAVQTNDTSRRRRRPPLRRAGARAARMRAPGVIS